MKKNILWLIVIFLMTLSLVLASCAPATPSTEEKPAPPSTEKPAPPTTEKPTGEKPAAPEQKVEMVTIRLTKNDGTTVQKQVEKPRYGDVFTQGWPAAPTYFDESFGYSWLAPTIRLTNEPVYAGDWAKGPAGTGEASWLYVMYPAQNVERGCLAESWEVPDDETIIYHIRKGIHFHNKPPTNGRELTADDVAFSMERNWTTPTCYTASAFGPYLKSATATDKWTVVLKVDPLKTPVIFRMASMHTEIVPRDAVETYGDLSDWKNSCGTGAFTLTDYVTGSSATFEKNPNYWMKNPVHPDDSLPYVDKVKYLFIPDISTQLAALRTAKIDWLGPIGWEDAGSVIRTSPEIKWMSYPSGAAPAISMRVDRTPLDNIKVRQALALAVDNQAIAKNYYGGEAEILTWPIMPIPEFSDMYIPLDELPASTRELYEYHQDKAKQLLGEAGYPNGFKTSVLCQATDVDLLSIVKDYWAQIGVQLELDVRELGAYTSAGRYKKYEQMHMGGLTSTLPDFGFTFMQRENYLNYSMIDDPVIEKAYKDIVPTYFKAPAKGRQLFKEMIPHLLSQCYWIQLPAQNSYHLWQPWVKEYAGEIAVGYASSYADFAKYVWIDQDLKAEMMTR